MFLLFRRILMKMGKAKDMITNAVEEMILCRCVTAMCQLFTVLHHSTPPL